MPEERTPVERITSFNRDRVLWCCEQNQVAPAQLAQELSISITTLLPAINENGSLTMLQLQKIAEYFHRGLLFFFEEGSVDEAQTDSVQFRTINNQKPHLTRKVKILIRRVEEQRQVFLNLTEGEDESLGTKWQQGRPERASDETIKGFANRVRQWLTLGNNNEFDSYRNAIEKAGILVFVTNGYAGKWQIEKENLVRGFSLYFDVCPVIVAKKQESAAAQSFTVIHELGHLLLHRTSAIDEEQDFYIYQGREREANEFAGNLLVPDYLLEQIDLDRFPFSTVSRYDTHLMSHRQAWGVSGDVIVRRLRDESLLSPSLYEEYLGYKRSLVLTESASGGSRFRYKEPLNIFGRGFVEVVFEAVHNDEITINKASKYLDNLKIADLRELEGKLLVHV